MSMNARTVAAGHQQPTAAQLAAMQRAQNRAFMSLSVPKEALCLQANGGASNQAYAAGQPLTYNVSTANNAFITGIWVRCSLVATLGAGTSAVYQLNAGAPMNLIDSINVSYGGPAHNFRPYMLKYLSQMMGRGSQTQPRAIVAGQQDTYLQSYYGSTTPKATGANTWNFAFYLPFNLIHPQDVRGIMPIQNGETTCQITINCAGAAYGTDAVLNTFSLASGSGGSAAITGTIAVIATYKDGQSFSQLTALQPNLSGLETVQLQRDNPLNNLNTGQVYRNKISFLHKIPWLWITVIDGISPTTFCSTSNIQLLDVTADQTGNRPFWRYGLNTNLDVRAYYDDLCGQFGGLLQQDFDEGIFPLVYGPIAAQASASILEGQAYLDMTTSSGWTDFHYGVQVAAIGNNANPGPRVEVTAVILNDPLVM